MPLFRVCRDRGLLGLVLQLVAALEGVPLRPRRGFPLSLVWQGRWLRLASVQLVAAVLARVL